ncbi:MAG: hypothetical protein GXC78_11310 [Chitinophagaceae bacterium]|nr:hypothetical protein [Chitinophagaceae bacterium]
MISLSFTFTTKCFYYLALMGVKSAPVFHSKNKIALPANYGVAQTVAWFEAQLDLLLSDIKPDIVSYKLTINNVTNNYVRSVYYGQAILNLCCQKKPMNITHVSPSAIVASKFNQPKNTDLHIYLDSLIGTHAPYWDNVMRDTALIALIQLP